MDTVLHRPRDLSDEQRSGRYKRYVRFAAVGALGTALYYLALILQVEALRVPVLTATCLAFAMVVAVNYALHRNWTFRNPVAHRRALLPFAMMSAVGFFINTAAMAIGLALDVYYMLAQTGAVAAVVTWNYIFTTKIFAQPAMPAANVLTGEHDGPI